MFNERPQPFTQQSNLGTWEAISRAALRLFNGPSRHDMSGLSPTKGVKWSFTSALLLVKAGLQTTSTLFKGAYSDGQLAHLNCNQVSRLPNHITSTISLTFFSVYSVHLEHLGRFLARGIIESSAKETVFKFSANGAKIEPRLLWVERWV